MSEKNKPQPPVTQPRENRGNVVHDSGRLIGNTSLPGGSANKGGDTFVMQSQPRRPIGGGSGNGSGGNNGGSTNNR